MSGTINPDRLALLSAARRTYVDHQQTQALLTGKPANLLPTNSALLASDPTLREKIKKIDQATLQVPANSSSTSASKPTAPVDKGNLSVNIKA